MSGSALLDRDQDDKERKILRARLLYHAYCNYIIEGKRLLEPKDIREWFIEEGDQMINKAQANEYYGEFLN